MTFNAWVRVAHRWVSMAFAGVVALIFALLGLGVTVPQWLYFVPLAPLAGLLLSGLWLFALPYLGRRPRAAA